MRILLLADTHVPSRAQAVPQEVWDRVADADAVFHAGDFESGDLVDELRAASKSFHAVSGNMDKGVVAGLPERLVVDVAGLRMALVHGHQWGRPRPSRLAQEFAGQADVVVFGHTHLPVVRRLGGITVVNPGSPTCPRGHLGPSYALVTVDERDVRIDMVEMRTIVGR